MSIAERISNNEPSDFEDLYVVKSSRSLEPLLLMTKRISHTAITSGQETCVGLPSQRVQSQQDKSKDEYKILDEERRCLKQGVHVCYPETAKDTTYLPESGELCWWMDSRRRLPEILLKMNLPDHRIKLWEMETPRSSEVNSPPNALQRFNASKKRHHDN
ncbi:hypothetical protein Tco_0032351 [Tanacetum coccineum]